jgi:hypothetical protein
MLIIQTSVALDGNPEPETLMRQLHGCTHARR